MNMHQKELIEDEIRLIENSNKIISDYKQSWDETLEKFEVKNLESVQGDERDCIFISTLFGPNENGNVLPDEILAVRFENGYDELDQEDDD